MFVSWYNEGTSNITAPRGVGRTAESLPTVGAKRCAAMSKPIVAQKRPGNIERNKARRKMPADYHALAASRGFEWIGPETPTTLVKTGWRCAHGHEWQSRYSAIKDGNGCPWCNWHSVEDYRALAASRGFTWLGPEVRTVADRTRWRCHCGHEWEASYTNLRGCGACWNRRKGDVHRLPTADYHRIAEDAGYKWLGPEVNNHQCRTNWLCPNGHTWIATYETFSRGSRCTECRRRSEQDYHEVATARGFKWVGERPRNNKIPTAWQCSKGHVWEASFNNVQRGSGCPQCLGYVNGVRVSSQQRALCDAVGGVLNYRVGRYTVDAALFVGKVKIACEYDAYYWHAGNGSNEQKRIQRLIASGWKVLAVKSAYAQPSAEQIERAITALLNGEDYHEIMLDDWGGEKVANGRGSGQTKPG